MIVCPRCSKENQDHYKFCLGCGAELPRDQAGLKDFSAPKPPPPEAPPVGGSPSAPVPARDQSFQFAATQQGDLDMAPPVAAAISRGGLGHNAAAAGVAAARLAATDAAPAAGPQLVRAPSEATPEPNPPPVLSMRDCPACSQPVPADFKFCGACGHRMEPGGGAVREARPAGRGDRQAGSLVLINPDGTEGVTYPLTGASVTIGRNAGGPFAADSYLSPVHATFVFAGAGCTVRDERSLNGVYYKIPRDTPIVLNDGAVFRIGQEILHFAAVPPPAKVNGVEPMGSPNPGYLGRISLLIGRQSFGNAFLIPPDGAHIGRERGDVVFPHDGYVSGLHCRISNEGGRVVLTDVGSSNGTFVRILGERTCSSGELLLMGQQLFRLQF